MAQPGGNATLLGLGVLVAVAGATFVLQGLGVPIGHSFMIGDLRWTAIGAAMLAGVAVVGWWQVRRR